MSSTKFCHPKFHPGVRELTHWTLGDLIETWSNRFFYLNLGIGGWGISREIDLKWKSEGLTDDESTLGQVMAWCRQATSHYLSQCWPRSVSPYGVPRPQRVNRHMFTGMRRMELQTWPSCQKWWTLNSHWLMPQLHPQWTRKTNLRRSEYRNPINIQGNLSRKTTSSATFPIDRGPHLGKNWVGLCKLSNLVAQRSIVISCVLLYDSITSL